MAKYKLHVGQEFSCTYIVEGDTIDEAWSKLFTLDPSDAECVEQIPEGLLTTQATSGIEVFNAETGDWADVD